MKLYLTKLHNAGLLGGQHDVYTLTYPETWVWGAWEITIEEAKFLKKIGILDESEQIKDN